MNFKNFLDDNGGFLNAHCNRTLDEALQDLVLSHGDVVIGTGAGRIFTGKNHTVIIEGYVKRISPALKHETYENNVLPLNRYHSIQAKTTTGQELRAQFADYSHHGSPDFQKWIARPHQVQIDRLDHTKHSDFDLDYHFLNYVSLRSIITTPPGLEFLYPSEIRGIEKREGEENEYSSSHTNDWWELEFEGTLYHLKIINDAQSEVTLVTNIRPLKQLLTSHFQFVQWLSFATGKELKIFGYESDWGLRKKALLYNNDVSETGINRPVPTDVHARDFPNHWKSLIKCLLTFTSDCPNHPIIPYMSMCWRSSETYLDCQELILATCIEGFAEWIIKKSPYCLSEDRPEAVEFQKLKETVISLLHSSGEITSNASFNRIKAIIESAKLLNQRNQFFKAAELVSVELSSNEFKAWQDMRNHAAHGELKKDGPGIKLNRYNVCLTLFYKLILGAIRYQGAYINYGKRGAPVEWLTGEIKELENFSPRSYQNRSGTKARIW